MARAKRKRKSETGRDVRLTDPYLLKTPPCRLTDHHRKQHAKNTGVLRNCVDNPNCLYGLGEHQKGVWQGGRLIRRVFGEDPRDRQRGWINGTPKPCGLRNLGATCYLNSMLQCLFVNLPFRQAVYEWEPKEQLEDKAQALQMRALQKLFAQMQLGNESYYDPTEFASTLSLNNVMQQDAQEFSKLLLAHSRTIFRQSKFSKHWDLVDRIFQGQMRYVTKCLKCKNKSMRASSYYEISLNIKGHKSVDDCIRSYLAAEVLEAENKYFCEHCDAKQCAERYLELRPRALPPTLMVQLMRFVYDASAGRKKKLMDVIEIDETLNMTELLRRSGHAEAFDRSGDAIYRLQGYLNHRGKSAHVGHYTASVAYPKPWTPSHEDGPALEWFEFDDAMVNTMTAAEVTKKRRHGKKIRSRDIYMLLYVRDDSVNGQNTDSTSSNHISATKQFPLPSAKCQEEVEVLNTAFNAKIAEYTSKVSGMEARIQERLDAYKQFFEKSHPYPDPSATHFYWVDTEWLRHWVTGEEYDSSCVSSRITGKVSESESLSNGEASNSNIVDESSDQDDNDEDNDNDDDSMSANPTHVDIAEANEKSDDDGVSTTQCTYSVDEEIGQTHCNDDGVDIINETLSSGSRLPTTSDADESCKTARGLTARDDDIPFAKPIDVASFCCAHASTFGVEANGQKRELAQRVLRFAPENVVRLKRISAKLFAYFNANCGVEPEVGLSATGDRAQMRVFEAPDYRCAVCEEEFCKKLLSDVNRLKEVEEELGMLKGTPASVAATVAAGDAYLISRAWIKTYKNHLQILYRELSHVASVSKKGRKSFAFPKANDLYATSRDANVNGSDSASAGYEELEVWQRPINDDITCLHGNLTLEKRAYRPVSAKTWSYFSAKFPFRAEYAESTTNSCPQCRVDETASKECIQAELDARDNILSDAALGPLYRRKPRGDSIRFGDVFELPAAQRGSGLEKASVWTSRDTMRVPRRIFLVSRHWLAQWREYMRNVREEVPLPLMTSSLLCMHQKLVLPPGLSAAQEGQLVDAGSLEVEFVSQDEMQALAERYGDPDMSIYYGLLVAIVLESGGENSQVVWRKCSLASLKFGNEQAVNSEGCPNGIVPLVCQDTNDESVICAQCQASSDQRHCDELKNFSNRVVNVQQLNDDQTVPTSENLTSDANTSGRRRSRRIRPGSACTWPIIASATDTVYMLKTKIYAEIDALPIRQRLYYKGEVLEDYRTLKQCGVKAGDAVFMRLSEDSADDLVMDESVEREIGFANSVFHSHHSSNNHVVTSDPDTSGDQALAMAMASSHESQVWVCSACTFVNDDTDVICEMCSTTNYDVINCHER